MANLPISELPLVPSGSPESLMVIVDYNTESSGVTSSIYYSSITNNISSKKYGQFISRQNQGITGATTNAYIVKAEVPVYENGVTVVDDSKFYVDKTATYNFDFSLQLEKSGVSVSQISVWLRVNGEDVEDTTGYIAITGSILQSKQIIGWNTLLELNAGDYVELVWASDNNFPLLYFVSEGSNPIRPASPSTAITLIEI